MNLPDRNNEKIKFKRIVEWATSSAAKKHTEKFEEILEGTIIGVTNPLIHAEPGADFRKSNCYIVRVDGRFDWFYVKEDNILEEE